MEIRGSKKKDIGIAVGTGLGIYIVMRYIFPVLFPFFIGWFFAVLVLPFARWMEIHWKIRRGIAGTLLMGILTVVLFFLLWKGSGVFLRQSGKLLENLGFLKEGWEDFIHQGCIFVEKYTGIQASTSEEFLLQHMSQWGQEIREKLQPVAIQSLLGLIRGSVTFFAGFIVIFVFGSLLIKDLEEWKKKMEQHVFGAGILRIGKRIGVAAGSYLRAQGVIMLVVIGICIAGLWILGNPYFLIAGILIGALDALPFIGAGTVFIPWAVILLLQGEYLNAVYYLVLFVICNLVRQLLEPRLIGNGLGIHPAVVLAAVYLGITMFGFSGVVLGPLSVLLFREIWREWKEYSGNEKNKKKDINFSQNS